MTDERDFHLDAELNAWDARMDRQDEWLRQLDADEHARRASLHSRRPIVVPSLEQLLDFEAKHPGFTGRKLDAIRATFDLGPANYFQFLNRAIRTPQALEHNPMLVTRLLALIEQRTRARALRVFRAPIPN